MQRFERPKLCRLCEFPVVDGGVRVSREELDKVSRWMERKFGSGLLISVEEEEESLWWICQFCSWDARCFNEYSEDGAENGNEPIWWPRGPDEVYEKYYKEDLLRPCFVDIEGFQKVKLLEAEASLNSPPNSNYASGSKPETADTSGNGRNDQWLCIYCSRSVILSSREYHVKKHHKDLAIKCTYHNCTAYFKTEDVRTEHIQKVHENVKGVLECIYCKMWFLNLMTHVKTRHKNEFIKCSYLKCPTLFKSEIDKEDHIKQIHEAEKMRKKYPCLFCDQVICKYSHLVKHAISEHGELLFKCKVRCCGFYFKTEVELQSHVEEKHPQLVKAVKAKIYKCSHCNYVSYRKYLIKQHIMIMHGPKNFECSLCTKKFSSEGRLKYHIPLHEKKSCPYCQLLFSSIVLQRHACSDFCKYCKNKFPCVSLLKKHETQCMIPVGWKCSICSIHFNKHYKYKYHMKLKHNEQDLDTWMNVEYQSRGFNCTKCKKYFSSKHSLKLHQKTIHGEKTVLTCDLCKKRITSKCSMASHLSGVHKIRDINIECSACSKSFLRKKLLQRHWNSVHAKNDLVECENCGRIMHQRNLAIHMNLFH